MPLRSFAAHFHIYCNLSSFAPVFSSEHTANRFLKVTHGLTSVKQKKLCCLRWSSLCDVMTVTRSSYPSNTDALSYK